MVNALVLQLPNMLTTMRLLLSIPICLLILDENYAVVLWIALVAGISDGLDGWLPLAVGTYPRSPLNLSSRVVNPGSSSRISQSASTVRKADRGSRATQAFSSQSSARPFSFAYA
jgi:hypothetical protein